MRSDVDILIDLIKEDGICSAVDGCICARCPITVWVCDTNPAYVSGGNEIIREAAKDLLLKMKFWTRKVSDERSSRSCY